MEIYLAWVKILQKVLGGGLLFFDQRCIILAQSVDTLLKEKVISALIEFY